MKQHVNLFLMGAVALYLLWGCQPSQQPGNPEPEYVSPSPPSPSPTASPSPVPTPTPAPTPTPGPPDGYVLSFSDEFDVSGTPDPSVWAFEEGPWPYNDELETYTRDNAFIQDGMLFIEARKEERDGCGYTSARLCTADKVQAAYGYYEVRAAVPTGRGVWSAIWMLPSDTRYGGYLSSGEIDLMENVGYKPDTVYASLHTAANNSVKGNAITGEAKVQNPEDFHIYSLLWEENRMRMYVDGREYLRYQRPQKGNCRVWPFDLPFYLICNVAVGGSWGGKEGIDAEAFPQCMRIDYFRYYVPSDALPTG
jgi:beta-glucanase (GH16 family)